MPDFHPVVLHFPIVLFWTGLVFDLINWVWKKQTYPAGHWIIIAAALMSIPTALTGLLAMDEVPLNADVIHHRNMALITVSFGLLHAAFRFYILLKHKIFKSILLVVLSVVNVALVSITAELGGIVAFHKGIFLKPSDH
ncbi:MAG: hypothetical protein JSR58_05470 [Verrucomicrobia bacterium]|nr:hypothetical protein [Verrucomicrobiota bacterium]